MPPGPPELGLSPLILNFGETHTELSSTITNQGDDPLVVGALGADEATISTFFVTLILVRAPLTLSYGIQSRLLCNSR